MTPGSETTGSMVLLAHFDKPAIPLSEVSCLYFFARNEPHAYYNTMNCLQGKAVNHGEAFSSQCSDQMQSATFACRVFST